MKEYDRPGVLEGVRKPLVRILVDLEDYVKKRLKDKRNSRRCRHDGDETLKIPQLLDLKNTIKAYKIVIDTYERIYCFGWRK
jgi:hypothetical protein